MSKIQKDHLNRAAYVYVRQSSLAQVELNLESQRRQYGLAGRAKDLGWQDIHVIDEDLGRSGSGCVERRGFETLLSEVCQGRAGAVFAIEASLGLRFASKIGDAIKALIGKTVIISLDAWFCFS